MDRPRVDRLSARRYVPGVTEPASPPDPNAAARFAPKPPWLKVRAPGGEAYVRLKETFRALDLHTVCEEARCPNVGECWGEGTATIMLLGDTCTRGCRFCAVTTGDPRGAVDVREPEHVARALAKLELQYVVITMVDRDDLLDGGASHVARTVTRLRELRPDILIETLLGDFGGHLDYVDATVDARPDVWAHNIEVVRRLQRTIRDVRCSYDRSLAVLRRAKERAPERITKSSVMVGIGETDDEPSHHGSVGSEPAVRRQDAFGQLKAVDILRGGLVTDQDRLDALGASTG